MSKPTNKPGWTSTTNPISEPTSKKLTGWSAGEKPSAEHMNWLFKTISEWINHVDVDRVKGETGDAGPQGIDGNVGPVGPAGQSGGGGAKGITGDQGPVGDQGPQGAAGAVAGFDSTQNARVTTLESKARISAATTVSAGVPYSGQATVEITSASSSIDWSLSSSQKLNLSDNATISFANGVSGKVYFLSIQQPSGGSATVSWPGSVSWNNGSAPTLSTTGNTKDVFGFYFDGSGYIGYAINLLKGFRVSQSGSETKNGYIAGGAAGGSTSVGNINDIQKLNFNDDTIITIASTIFGAGKNSTGLNLLESLSSSLNFGMGTQSATNGYRMRAVYSTLVTSGSNSTTIAGYKMSFATEVSSIIRTANQGIIQNNRRPVAQSSLAGFILGASSPYSAKLEFSTDTYSTPSTITASALLAANYAGALSSETQGLYFDGQSSSTVRLLSFSTETVSTAATPQAYSFSCSEMVDASLVGYSQNTATTTSGGTSNCRKYNKSTYANSLLATTLIGVGGVSAAVQGTVKGYFCGGQNYTTGSNYDITTSGAATIKQIDFSSDAYSTSSTVLKKSVICAAGFEG